MIGAEKLKMLLTDGVTCVLSDGETVFKSCERGIKPLLKFIESGRNFENFSAADKIVGKASAFLYAYMGVKELYACVASFGAAEVCKKYGITLFYETLAERIINRKGDDTCPMEKAVAGVDDPVKAKAALEEKLKNL